MIDSNTTMTIILKIEILSSIAKTMKDKEVYKPLGKKMRDH